VSDWPELRSERCVSSLVELRPLCVRLFWSVDCDELLVAVPLL
jgi:hypothetical protein